MALFMKQDFSPPIFSIRWMALKFRPNMVLYSRTHIISILESGLLFREDSIEVEQECPSPDEVRIAAGGKGWMTRGEKLAAVMGVAACMAAFPPRSFHRSTLINLTAYATIPLVMRWAHRSQCVGTLPSLLRVMREYLALARRTAACLKEYQALHVQLGCSTFVIESTHVLLCRQQSSLAVLMSRASSAILGNVPWLLADVAWDAVERNTDDNLMKIHHAFLVVQSTLLKHLAMAHYIPTPSAQKLYKNCNERIYWIHSSVLPHLTEEFKENIEALERMYRLLKNSTSKGSDNIKKLGSAFTDTWLYSDIHTGIAKSCLEVKLALNKCNSLDVFLDSCAMNKQEINLDILNKDMDDIIEDLTKCLNTIQNSQLRLKKIQNKQEKEIIPEVEEVVENAGILKIEDRVPESKDEVFYFVKTDDDDAIQTARDLTTGPGKKERETSKIVFCELKRKLGKREDVMRERERQALAKTMPELKDIPEFPRQINIDEFVERRGYIKKLNKYVPKKRHLNAIKKIKLKNKKFRLNTARYSNENDITGDFYEANARLNVKSKLITLNKYYITKWFKYVQSEKSTGSSYKDIESSLSEGLTDTEDSANNKTDNDIKFSKNDLELSPSTSESDLESYKDKQRLLLKDIRKNRVVRKKNYPNHKPVYGLPSNHRAVIDNEEVDESLKPIEYSFGTGMAMASVLQISKKMNTAEEEVFIGHGELSTDSGNDEDV